MRLLQWILCVAVVVSTAAVGLSDDWSQWRGNQRDGVWRENGIINQFSAEELKPVWRQPIGTGYSSPTVVGDNVFIMDYDEKQQKESVRCFELATGEPRWAQTYQCEYTISYTAGPRAAVTVSEGKAYAVGAMGWLHCIDVDSGEVDWKKDLNDEYKIASSRRMPIWGIAPSPLVHDQTLILQIGAKDATVIGLDKSNGEESWRALDDRGQYSSPVITEQNNQPVVVCWTGDSVAGLNPKDGEVHWRHKFKPTRMPIGVATPIIKDNKIFLTSFYDGSMMLEMSQDEFKVEQLWHLVGENERSTEALHSIISTPIWIEDHIYGVDSHGELRCIKASDGSRVWEDLTAVKKIRWGTIHFVSHGNDVWMSNEQGELMIGQLSPAGLKIASRASVLEPNQMRTPNRKGGVCWSHPAYASKHVVLRNDSELICISLAE